MQDSVGGGGGEKIDVPHQIAFVRFGYLDHGLRPPKQATFSDAA